MSMLLAWDQTGERTYRTGVDHGVLYDYVNGQYTNGVAWSGLTSVNKTPSGAEDNKLYADNMEYLHLRSAETLGLTIECYTYPDEWDKHNGEATLATGVHVGQQSRSMFGFSYRNKIGNDVEGEDYGYEINLIYGCTASPSEQTSQTINDSPEAATLSYEVSTTPVTISGVTSEGKPFKPSASVVISSVDISKAKLDVLESVLYGKAATFRPADPMPEGSFDQKIIYYEKNGDKYVETKDSTPQTGKDYWMVDEAAVPARMPLPDEIRDLLAEG